MYLSHFGIVQYHKKTKLKVDINMQLVPADGSIISLQAKGDTEARNVVSKHCLWYLALEMLVEKCISIFGSHYTKTHACLIITKCDFRAPRCHIGRTAIPRVADMLKVAK